MPPVPGLLHHALSARSPQAFSPATSSSAFAEPIITFTVRLFYIKPTPQHTAILQDLVAWIVLSLLNFQVLHSFSSFSQPKNIPLSPLKKKKSFKCRSFSWKAAKKKFWALLYHSLTAPLSVPHKLASEKLFLQKWPTTPVMVNFMWQLDWATWCLDNSWNVISGHVCDGRDWHLDCWVE